MDVGKMLSDYANKTAINRNKMNKVCQDIYILGLCIVQKSAQKDLNVVYTNKTEPTEPQLRVDDLGEVVCVVLELRQKLQTMEKDNADTKKEYADYKEKCTKDTAELKAEINRVKAKCDQCNSNEGTQAMISAIQPETPNVSQEDVIPERNGEEHGLLMVDNTQPEDSEPHEPTRPTIRPAPKMTDLFIGGVDASHSCSDIRTYMNTGTALQVEVKDIQEKQIRGDKKAFKVSVPHDKVQEAVSIWPREITAERYMAPRIKIKPAKPSNAQARTDGNNRNNRNSNNNGNNRNSNNSGNNRNNNRGNAHNRHNSSSRNQRNNRRHAFQDQSQNRHGPPSYDQYFQPAGNFQRPIPSIPPIPNQYWNQYKAPSWPPHPFFNF